MKSLKIVLVVALVSVVFMSLTPINGGENTQEDSVKKTEIKLLATKGKKGVREMPTEDRS